MSTAGIIIQGTKDGFKTLYTSRQLPEADKMSIGYDIRLSSPSEDAIGKQCYGISFSPGGKVYTIYRAMYDGPRNMAVGFLGISLFIPKDKKLGGKQLQELLNDLMERYLSYTIEDKLGVQPEDWSFIEVTLQKYDALFREESNPTVFFQGVKDAAYIFYAEPQLPVYFEEIYQNQYKNYRQILLVDKKQQHDNNILSAIKGVDDITHKVDIENPTYQLSIQDPETTRIKVKNETLEDKQEITRETKLEVEFSKPHHLSKQYDGTCKELVKQDASIFIIEEKEKKFIIKKQLFKIIKKELTIHVTDEDGVVKREDISITFNKKNSSASYCVPGSTITFEGEGIIQTWIIHITGKKYSPASKVVTPEEELYDSLFFELKKKKRKFPILRLSNNPGVVFIGILCLIMGLVALALTSIDPFMNEQSAYTKEETTPTPGQPPTSHISSNPKPDTDLIANINDYTSGMELSMAKLNGYLKTLEAFPNKAYDPSHFKLDNAIKLRTAIDNSFSKEEIKYALAHIKGLTDNQNNLLKLIKDNFEIFSQIDNPSDLALSTIQYKINAILEAQKPKPVKVKPGSEQPKDFTRETVRGPEREIPDNSNNKKQPTIKPSGPEKYSLEAFAARIKQVDTREDLEILFDEAKMTEVEINYYNIIKDNFSKFLKLAHRKEAPAAYLLSQIRSLQQQ